MWGKEGLCNIGQKRNEKKRNEKNISLLACPRWRRRDLRGLSGGTRWRGGGLRTRHVGKRGLCNTGQKREETNIYLLTCPRMRQWQRRDLRGLRGEAQWRGGGLRTWHVGKRGLSNGQKRNEKKKKKNITLLAYPQVQAMAAVGVGAKGKRQQRRGGLRVPRRGCSRPSCVGCGDGPHGVVAATRRRAVKEEKKNVSG